MTTVPLTALVADLRFYSRVQTSEGFSDPSDLERFIVTATSRHNPSYTITSEASLVPVGERSVVVLLAWSLMCRVRASRFSTEANISQSGGFGTDRNTPYYKCMDLAKDLEEQYKSECTALGLTTYYGSYTNAVTTTVTCENVDLMMQTPVENSLNPPPITLTAGNTVVSPDGTLVLRWTQEFYENFESYTVFHATGPTSIYQDWNFAGTVPRILDAASQSMILHDQTIKAVKLTGLAITPSLVNRYLIIGKSRSGKMTYSNEVTTTQAA